MKLGALTGCHQKQERSFHFYSYQFPLCARCTGLLFGEFLAVLLLPLHGRAAFSVYGALALLSTVLLAVDGFGQLLQFWESTNARRLISGLLCGFFVTGLLIRLLLSLV